LLASGGAPNIDKLRLARPIFSSVHILIAALLPLPNPQLILSSGVGIPLLSSQSYVTTFPHPQNSLPAAAMSKVFSSKEVSEHKTVENGMWVVIDGSVYDVTQFINEHPGGPKILKRSAGKDASKSFWKVSGMRILNPLRRPVVANICL
jgi:cytochrome b involved in lipid metabolism